MAGHVAQQVRLFTPDENGETRNQRRERFGLEPEAIDPVAPDLEYLLQWFWDMHSARSSGMNGPNPLSLADIEAWSRLTGHVIRREEIDIVRQMDAAFIRANAKEQAEALERSRK